MFNFIKSKKGRGWCTNKRQHVITEHYWECSDTKQTRHMIGTTFWYTTKKSLEDDSERNIERDKEADSLVDKR